MFYTGLPAQYYDSFFVDSDTAELLFFKTQLEHAPGPALEIGCGTGRILLPLLKQGLHVEGFDISPEMLALCRKKGRNIGLEPILYEQAMQYLKLPKKYGCLYSPLGTFQQLSNIDDAYKTLYNFYAHIMPGGRLVLCLYLPWYNAAEYGKWHAHEPIFLDDERMLSVYEKVIHDPIEQQLFMSYRYHIYQHKLIIREEEKELTIRWYSRYEIELMLKAVGFQQITIYAGYEDTGPFDTMLVVAYV